MLYPVGGSRGPSLEGHPIAIDGKCVRGSHDGKHSAIHLVLAWSSATGLTLGQIKPSDKSNEITAIPELLGTLDIRGGVITIDAMGCQRDIAAKMVDHGVDYVLGVKDNQLGTFKPKRIMVGLKPAVALQPTTSPGCKGKASIGTDCKA